MSNAKPTIPGAGFPGHSQNSIRLDIQGLRAVAVLAVLVYHANAAWLKAGFVGVDVFFVISGFIITALLTERGAKVELGAFYASRIKRILPAYLAMLLIVCVGAAILFLPADFSLFFKSLKSSLLFTSNRYFADFGSYFAPQAYELPLLHTWSLAIEMQFYLFFPLLVILLPRAWRLPVFVVAALALFGWSAIRVLGDNTDGALYFSLLARVPEFLVGAVIMLALRDRELPLPVAVLLGLLGALVLGSSLWLVDRSYFPGFWSMLPCLGAGLLIAARRGPVNSLLACAPLVWIGGISYSLYLWHWPVLAFIRYYTGEYVLSGAWLAVFLLAALLLAWLSYRFVELPVRASGRIRRQLPKWALALGVLVLSAMGARLVNERLLAPLPVEMTTYAPDEQICHGTLVGECKRGRADAPVSALVIGDSHAAQLNFFFDEVGNELGTAYRLISSSNCVPIPGFDVERLAGWAQPGCKAQMNVVAADLPNMQNVVIAGMWQFQVQSPAFLEGFEAFLRSASQQGKAIVVLAQVPMFVSNPLRLRRFHELGMPVQVVENDSWRSANATIRQIANGIPGVTFIDMSDAALFKQAPYYNGSLMYLDNHHLNQLGAREYGHIAAGQFRQVFKQLIANKSSEP
ncbi:acyltransferase family protein [Pseudomonas oryziphila]|uniref:acyltransferase family protein n=1 Tax=Pseudomonas oryziphila TaxID=2894079 RepID=UPI001CB8DDA9|nr:acyltransferase family protein [Pseudomonas oryziphila]